MKPKFKVGDEVELDVDWYNAQLGENGQPFDFSNHDLKVGQKYVVKQLDIGIWGNYIIIEGHGKCWKEAAFKEYIRPINFDEIPSNLTFWQNEVTRLQLEFTKEKNPLKLDHISNALITANLRLQRELKEQELCLNS